jgi:hypothetical protein
VGIIHDGRIGFKPSIVIKTEHNALEKKLKDAKNGIRGYLLKYPTCNK